MAGGPQPRARRAARLARRRVAPTATIPQPRRLVPDCAVFSGRFPTATMSTIIDSIERRQLKEGLPSFSPGDRVRVHFQVVEGNRRRTQVFEGIVLKRQGSGRGRPSPSQAVLRGRRRADLPAALPEDREARDRRPRRRPQGEALLPARPGRQGRPGGRAPLGHRRGGDRRAPPAARARRSTPRASGRKRWCRWRRPSGGRGRGGERGRGSREPKRRRLPRPKRRGRAEAETEAGGDEETEGESDEGSD